MNDEHQIRGTYFDYLEIGYDIKRRVVRRASITLFLFLLTGLSYLLGHGSRLDPLLAGSTLIAAIHTRAKYQSLLKHRAKYETMIGTETLERLKREG